MSKNVFNISFRCIRLDCLHSSTNIFLPPNIFNLIAICFSSSSPFLCFWIKVWTKISLMKFLCESISARSFIGVTDAHGLILSQYLICSTIRLESTRLPQVGQGPNTCRTDMSHHVTSVIRHQRACP